MSNMMRALVKAKPEVGLWMENVPVPEPGPNDVLIKVRKSAICGTDVHIWNWDAWAQKTIPVPMVVGHEFVGEVAGIGSAVINNGVLVPNTELGHLEIEGFDAETRASANAKAREKLSFKRWAKRLQTYYSTLEKLFWPDLFVVGGGVSKSHEKFLPQLNLRTPIVPAQLLNSAGIVGAAAVAAQLTGGLKAVKAAGDATGVAVSRWDSPTS